MMMIIDYEDDDNTFSNCNDDDENNLCMLLFLSLSRLNSAIHHVFGFPNLIRYDILINIIDALPISVLINIINA